MKKLNKKQKNNKHNEQEYKKQVSVKHGEQKNTKYLNKNIIKTIRYYDNVQQKTKKTEQ